MLTNSSHLKKSTLWYLEKENKVSSLIQRDLTYLNGEEGGHNRSRHQWPPSLQVYPLQGLYSGCFRVPEQHRRSLDPDFRDYKAPNTQIRLPVLRLPMAIFCTRVSQPFPSTRLYCLLCYPLQLAPPHQV